MESTHFCYWLQGFFEISKTKELTESQVEIIKKHLASVFTGEILNANPTVLFDTIVREKYPKSPMIC